MSAPLTVEILSTAFKNLALRRAVPVGFLCINKTLLIQECSLYSPTRPQPSNTNYAFSNPVLSQHILATAALAGYKLNPSRQYGRKVKPKPPKITFFQYSGDLRKLPELDKSTILYPYQDFEDKLNQEDIVKKLSSLEFASAAEIANHKRQVVLDRIIEMFGPNSEIEQQIALLTLGIRQMIPYCIARRTDKGNKIFLLKRIFRRRRLLTRLRELDHQRFDWLLRELKIQYILPRDREEYKGWKYNLRMSTQNEATAKQRKKLEMLKEKYEAERMAFFERKAKVLAEIEADLQKFGLSRDFLDQLQVAEKQETPKEVKVFVPKDEPIKVSRKKKKN